MRCEPRLPNHSLLEARRREPPQNCQRRAFSDGRHLPCARRSKGVEGTVSELPSDDEHRAQSPRCRIRRCRRLNGSLGEHHRSAIPAILSSASSSEARESLNGGPHGISAR